MNAEKLAKIEELTKYTDLDIVHLYDQGMDFEEFEEEFIDWVKYQDITFYGHAMQYLKENDPGLHDSMAIAADNGYTLGDINSELLATLLYQQCLHDEWGEIRDQIEELFE